MRVLVTGATGFVGRHVHVALKLAGHQVIACSGLSVAAEALDIRDAAAVARAIDAARPEAVVHVAGQAFVPASIADPLGTIAINANGTANLLSGVRSYQDASGTAVRTVLVSSADVYAEQTSAVAINEAAEVRPINPYGASKLAAEHYARAWIETFGLDVVIARPFNQFGPGQSTAFAVPSFAHQLAKIAAGGSPVMHVGNLDAQRDFLDVRDLARALVALLEAGRSGDVYNVSSGRLVTIREVLRQLITIARVPVEVRDDAARMRATDKSIRLGDSSKLREHTNWDPEISFATSLRDIYADAVSRVAAVNA